ncbi:MAG: indole-3-glycerol phosphate synthase TrpC [Candidatus Carbobacillus sp.]|nr:indole-3-glycerol phosphate synthase TrpC [Candidatus Carbobacillus sp.]
MLQNILVQKEKEVLALYERYGSELQRKAVSLIASRNKQRHDERFIGADGQKAVCCSLLQALQTAGDGSEVPALIAEIKRKSPSKGVLRETFDPLQIARDYTQAHVHAISVLTDVHFFAGNASYVSLVKTVADVPVLRKDFIIDRIQLYESVVIGADAVLLIVRALSRDKLIDLYQEARRLHLDVLVEVHDKQELERALLLPEAIIGINNRNLDTFETTLDVTYALMPHIPRDRLVVSESGIRTYEDMRALKAQGVTAVLVGETLMRQTDLVQAVHALRAGTTDR